LRPQNRIPWSDIRRHAILVLIESFAVPVAAEFALNLGASHK